MESINRQDRDHEELGPSISQWAKDRLSQSCYSALGYIACSYRDGVLKLEGSVPSHYLKQVAQELVWHVAGVDKVVNQIKVAAARNRNRT